MTYKKSKELLFCIKIFSSYLMAVEAFHFCKPACKTIGLHLNMSCWELDYWSACICRSHTVSFSCFSTQAHSKWRLLNFLPNGSFSDLYFHLLVKSELFFFFSVKHTDVNILKWAPKCSQIKQIKLGQIKEKLDPKLFFVNDLQQILFLWLLLTLL